ncbi:glutathione S-transferase family protein [Baekduia soli]|nr:glutathione S-transferase family protein [Baekduia soli]
MTTIRVHGWPVSTWTRTAAMTCIEKGAEYELVALDRFSPEHYALHPFGRMPVVEVGGLVLTETPAIACHLDECLGGPALQPEDLPTRTAMRRWMSICADYVFHDVVRAIPRGRPASAEELAVARTALERVESLVGDGPFLAGDGLTLADLFLAPQIANAREKAPEVLDGLGAIAAWAAGIEARESFRRTAYDPASV